MYMCVICVHSLHHELYIYIPMPTTSEAPKSTDPPDVLEIDDRSQLGNAHHLGGRIIGPWETTKVIRSPLPSPIMTRDDQALSIDPTCDANLNSLLYTWWMYCCAASSLLPPKNKIITWPLQRLQDFPDITKHLKSPKTVLPTFRWNSVKVAPIEGVVHITDNLNRCLESTGGAPNGGALLNVGWQPSNQTTSYTIPALPGSYCFARCRPSFWMWFKALEYLSFPVDAPNQGDKDLCA